MTPCGAIGTPPFRRTVPATHDCVPRLRAAVVDYVRAAGLPAALVEDVRLAVSEAITNVVVHAYADFDVPGPLHLTADVRDGELTVTIADEGRGLAARADSPGAGLGLAIITQLASDVELSRGDGTGTRVRMTFG